MKLSNKTLQSLIHGSYLFREEKGGYMAFSHYDEAQLEYLKFNPFYYDRAKFSSSVTVEVVTDAAQISFDYKMLFVGSLDTIDVYANGVPVSVVELKDLPEKGNLSFVLPEGNKKVVVYFPLDVDLGVKNFCIEGKWRSPKEKKPKCLWIGDSITQGYGAFITGETYVNSANRALGYEVLNQGIGGYWYDEKIVTKMEGYEPDKIIVAMGTNQHKSADKKERIVKFYERLSEVYPSVPVLAITPLWRGDDGSDMEKLIETAQIIRDTAAKYPNVKVVDGFTLVPHVNAYFMDSLHPTALGMRIYAENLVKEIRKLKF